MKFRTDFVTNSSSSCFTVITLNSPLLEKWIQENPVSFSGSYRRKKPREFTSVNPLLEAVAQDLNYADCKAEFDKHKGIVDNIIDILCGGNEKPNESFGPIVDFMKANRTEIERESEGIIVNASQFEGDIPEIDAIKYKRGQSRYMILDPESIEDAEDEDEEYEEDEDLFEDLFDVESYTPEMILDALENYGHYMD